MCWSPTRHSAVLKSPLVEELVAAGRLGQKTGQGFYHYQNKKRRAETDAALNPFIAKHKKEDRDLEAEEIQDRLLLPMLLEATRVLDEQIVENAPLRSCRGAISD